MSDYFGALIQSSGLRVERGAGARQHNTRDTTPSPTDYGIEEVDEHVSVVSNKSQADRTISSESLHGDVTRTHIGEAGQPGETAVNRPWSVEEARSVNPVPIFEAQATPPSELPADVAGSIVDIPIAPSIGEVAGMAAVSLSEASVISSRESSSAGGHGAKSEAPRHENIPSHATGLDALPSGYTVVQAALRWVASGESSSRTVSKSAPTTTLPASKDMRARGEGEDVADSRMSEERHGPSSSVPPAQTHAVEAAEALYDSVQDQHDQTHDFSREDAVEITIGSINVRVDAPPQSAVAVTAPSPAPHQVSEPSPRSSLARRTLWRI